MPSIHAFLRGSLAPALRGAPYALVDPAGGVAHRFHHRTRHVLGEYLGMLVVLAALALALVGLGGV
jgi:hypothetical protein